MKTEEELAKEQMKKDVGSIMIEMGADPKYFYRNSLYKERKYLHEFILKNTSITFSNIIYIKICASGS